VTIPQLRQLSPTPGIIALANAIPDNRALIKLDISNNHIRDEQDGDLRRICVASGIKLARY
jgi:hypothetical protein